MKKLNILKKTYKDGAVINPKTQKLFFTIIFKMSIFLHIFSTHKNWEPT